MCLKYDRTNQLRSGLDIHVIDKNKKGKINWQQLRTYCWFQCNQLLKRTFPFTLPCLMIKYVRDKRIKNVLYFCGKNKIKAMHRK